MKIAFKKTKENENDGLYKYNKQEGIYQAYYGDDLHSIECVTDNQK